MTAKPQPAWPLPVLALGQMYAGTVLLSPLREPGAPWSTGYAVLAAVVSLAGLAVLALAVRNCRRLWRVPPVEASWSLVAATVLVVLFSALWATGPMSVGIWDWTSLIPGAFAAYLVVVLVREVRRRLRPARPPGQLADS